MSVVYSVAMTPAARSTWPLSPKTTSWPPPDDTESPASPPKTMSSSAPLATMSDPPSPSAASVVYMCPTTPSGMSIRPPSPNTTSLPSADRTESPATPP